MSFHSFHSWKNTTKQLFLLKFQCRIVRIWSKKCLIFLLFDSYVLTFNVIFCISSLPILVECSFMFYFWSWSSLLPKCNELKIKSDWKLRSPLSGVSGKIEFLFLIFLNMKKLQFISNFGKVFRSSRLGLGLH